MAKDIVRIPVSSPLYPLPEDYEELTREGMRQARVNGLRQWQLPGSNAFRGDAFVACLRFFDLWYLWPDPDVDFDPMFYDMDPMPSPVCHFDMAKQWAVQRASISIAPRGVGKTFDIRKACMMRLLTAWMYSIWYATSTADNAKATGMALRDQFENNRRINDDWGPEFPKERVAPKRGERTFGNDYFQLMNGAWMRCISSESKQRGGRPRRYVLDDPEYDEKNATSMQVIRDYMTRLLFKVVLPMLMRPGCGVDWVATFVSRRHYAWFAMQTEAIKGGKLVAKDPRFNMWSRMVIKAAYEKEGVIHSCWPEMWPATIEEKEERGLDECISLEEIRAMIGEPNFQAEYMANPGVGDDIFFPQLTEEKHGYELINIDPREPRIPPRESRTRLRWYSTAREEWDEIELREIVRQWRLFMCLDASFTANRDSDRKTAMVMAVNDENDLFALDLWSDQCHEPTQCEMSLKMADGWWVPVMWPETLRGGASLYNNLYSMVSTRLSQDMGVHHVPAVKKLNPGTIEKEAKIASLQSRFNMGKVKLPLSDPAPCWVRLRNQIDEFNPEAKDGGLEKDDELDTLSMAMWVMRGRLSKAMVRDEPNPPTVMERLLSGEVTDENGNALGLGVDWTRVPASDIAALFAMRAGETDEPRESRA